MRVLGVIPARLSSTRLPRKVLREIAGLPMVVQVFRRARRSPLLSDLLVATDSEEVAAVCRAHGITAVMTSPDHPSGTDRLWEVSRAHMAEVYVNVQGDEPLVTPGHIERLVTPFSDDPDVQVTTLKIRATPDEVLSRTTNKVVTSVRGDALYFSRLAIPFDRDGRGGIIYWKHVGLYAYRRAVLDAFHSLPPSALEQAEKLEQLRLLENGIPIRVVETEEETIGVDTEEDLRLAEARLAARVR
ncbi:MAG: 3-deoxy-D-manno-octulosonate cytidylyltransferase [Candidatus Rokubacteria bacterium GWF2_70_14]|nr:MAG: 3-deoxy-D-manno-octulosonate cytidylyltransferase [Candidatus Rokubacteria bacterium GWA2_70_23]OGK92280.1 MAG: 3-deoxy-D-manno-octulosonate cytidylyltransferase [Candidatus Rokubacteria bacterium GWF2_70_14]